MHQTTTVENYHTAFFRFGHGKKKLVILHGWDQNIDIFKSYHELIHDLFLNEKFAHEYEIIMPNFPGFGKSAMPPATGFDTHDYANWLKKFLDQLKITNAVFLCHSFGGRVLIRFLLQNPNFAQQAILIASAGIKHRLSLRQKISIFLSKRLTRAKSLIPQKIQKFIITKIFGAKDWGISSQELKPTLEKVLAEPDFRHELPKIKTHNLIIWGKQDRITPLKSGKIFAKKLPHNQLIVIEDGNHGIHRTHATEISDYILQFLDCK